MGGEGPVQLELTAVLRKVAEGYIGLKEVRANLKEAAHLVLEANRTLAEEAIGGKDVIREPLRITAA